MVVRRIPKLTQAQIDTALVANVRDSDDPAHPDCLVWVGPMHQDETTGRMWPVLGIGRAPMTRARRLIAEREQGPMYGKRVGWNPTCDIRCVRIHPDHCWPVLLPGFAEFPDETM